MKNRDKDSVAASYCNTQMWVFLINIKVAFHFIITPVEENRNTTKKGLPGGNPF
ncbi:hypothetical protein [Agriterribacter sp.]|uniref:hypothetical protein n=1 Tax=Agriterribacter sp. TaxID=2821509 RepID=UPI002CFC4821|nr:hypothetical protein [Agriterribacter sp.]HRP55300.1 hypothetical protein [Agriterribacter sp.]